MSLQCVCAFTNISDTLSHQQTLVTSFDALLMQFTLVKIGDEIAKVGSPVFSPVTIRINSFFLKIHPYVNFAWALLSAGMKAS